MSKETTKTKLSKESADPITDKDKQPNAKQEKFCREYCLDLNATQAAIRAGYSEKSASSIGSQLLQKSEVKQRVKQLQTNAIELSGITHLRIIKELENIAFSNISTMQEGWFSYKEFEALPAEFKSAIRTIDTKEKTKATKDGEIIERDVKISLHDKMKALETLSCMLGYNKPQTSEESKATSPLNISVVSTKTQEEINKLINGNNNNN